MQVKYPMYIPCYPVPLRMAIMAQDGSGHLPTISGGDVARNMLRARAQRARDMLRARNARATSTSCCASPSADLRNLSRSILIHPSHYGAILNTYG